MTLRDMHAAEISDEKAWDLYTRLEAAIIGRDGSCSDACYTLIADAARCEELKQMQLADIAERGLGKEYNNYRQHYYKPNESVKELRSTMEQQRRILKELKLTPAAQGAVSVTVNDGFEEF